MKKILSLVLVLSLVLGSFPMAFAAEMAVEKTPGEILKGYEMISGDENGNLNEDQKLTRAAMMKLIAAMLGVEEEAKNYPLPSTFTDVPADAWYAGYVAYAQNAKWSNGVGEGLFAPEGEVTTQMAAKFMLTALGYEANWDTAVEDAATQGIMTNVDVAAEQAALRGQVFQMMVNTLEQNKAGTDVKLGVELGVVKPEAPEVATLEGTDFEVKSISFEKVEVTFKADVEDAAATNVDSYVITEKGAADNSLEVVSVEAQGTNDDDEAVYVLMTEEQKSGKAYTMSIGEKAMNFTGLGEDKKAPKVDKVKGSDTERVEITFDKVMDKASAEDVSNYSIANVEVVAAELDDDRKMVTLSTDGMSKKANRKVIIENVESVDGVAVKKVTKSFVSDLDTKGPKIDDVKKAKVKNNTKVYILFEDDHGLDKASAEDLSNYSISGLEIYSAEYIEKDTDAKGDDFEDKYDVVVLKTEEQTESKYTVKVTDVMDGSAAENTMSKEYSKTFRASDADEDAPKVKDATGHNGNELYVLFDEDNNLDPASALDIDNYEIAKDELDILEASFKDDDEDSKTIILKTSEMDTSESYELIARNIEDEFANVMKKDSERFSGVGTDYTAPEIEAIRSYIKDDEYKIDITFKNEVDKTTAEDPTNYVIDNGIGAALKASYDDDDNKFIVTLTTEKTEDNKKYEIVINNVADRYNNALVDEKVNFIGVKDGDDTERPTIEEVEAISNKEIRVTFSEKVDVTEGGTLQMTLTKGGASAGTADFAYLLAGDLTAVFVPATALTDDDYDYALESSSADYVADKSGNRIETEDLSDDFDGEAQAADKLKIDDSDYDQISATKIEFEFSEEVKLVVPDNDDRFEDSTPSVTVKIADKEDATFTTTYTNAVKKIEINEDDPELVTFTFTKKLDADKFLEINLQEVIQHVTKESVYDTASKTDKYVVELDSKDETAPILVEVVATDNRTVEVIYDEDLSDEGRYTITYEDDDGDDQPVDYSNPEIDDNKVILHMDSDLEGDRTYDLKVKTAAEDLSGVNEETDKDDIFTFDGTDKAPAKFITGVEVVNGSKVIIYTNEDVASGKDVSITTVGLKDAQDILTNETNKATDDIDVTLADGDVLKEDVEYTVSVEDFGTYKFKGIINDGGISIAVSGTGTSVANIDYSDFDDEDGYSMKVTLSTSTITFGTVKVNSVGVSGGSTGLHASDNGTDFEVLAADLTDDDVDVTLDGNLAASDDILVEVLDGSRVVYTKTLK